MASTSHTQQGNAGDEDSRLAPTHVKAPVDVETQCGVELPSERQCGGSLACKRHGMAAKRAVRGRSAPFDQLLQRYLQRQ
ncbi:SCA7, zinc-binding domain-containing protein [Neohortaea acidophila]|uniref:SCA7, zinc-binding domain-containing protein n=1 Tax=Neohortaea acidophila TaxID=245834 RepID=A0A6A6PNR8_9PEZI|nr:SCA7, zinc-binding domain-containing protein [Neohortaea acidophila]KAF2481274.1 SCA7, zinc-binding domain-containing protein [Neohortaea acidophila]